MDVGIIHPRISLLLNDGRKKMMDPSYKKREKQSGQLPLNAESPFGDFPDSYKRSLTISRTRESNQQMLQRRKQKFSAWAKRPIQPSELRRFYDRGDLPVRIHHKNSHNTIAWKEDIKKLDYSCYLPIFFDGLREKEDPYRLLAVQGVYDLIENGKHKLLSVIPQLIVPMQRALNTRDTEIVSEIMKAIQALLAADPAIGPALVPYYRQLLPVFNLLKNGKKNLGDRIDYSQQLRLNAGELIDETLQLLHMHGGKNAYVNIKYMVPTYENCETS